MNMKNYTELSRPLTNQKKDQLKGTVTLPIPYYINDFFLIYSNFKFYRCKELNDTILQNATRVKAAIKLTQEDASTIAILRREVEKAWKLVEQAKEKEEKARKIITDLRNEIAHLNKIVEQGSGLSIGQDNTVHNLMRQKDELKKDCDQKQETITELESQKSSLMEKIHKLENDLIREKDEIEKHKHEIEKLKQDNSQVTRERKTKEEELTKANNQNK